MGQQVLLRFVSEILVACRKTLLSLQMVDLGTTVVMKLLLPPTVAPDTTAAAKTQS